MSSAFEDFLEIEAEIAPGRRAELSFDHRRRALLVRGPGTAVRAADRLGRDIAQPAAASRPRLRYSHQSVGHRTVEPVGAGSCRMRVHPVVG